MQRLFKFKRCATIIAFAESRTIREKPVLLKAKESVPVLATNTHLGVEVQIQSFLTSATDESEW
jgi:hypothetical protein